MAEVHSLEDTMRRHDEAVLAFIRQLRVDYGNLGLGIEERRSGFFAPIDRNNVPILAVLASPQRAVAKTVDFLLHTGWLTGNSVEAQEATKARLEEAARQNFAVLPLPLVSVRRDDPLPNPQDAGVPKIFRKQCFDPLAGEWQQHQWPVAFETRYSLTFWSIKRYTEVFFREWVYAQLGARGVGNAEVLIPVEHNPPWNVMRQRFTFEGSADVSALEGADDARLLRFEFPFRLRTWHFRKVFATPSFVHRAAMSVNEVQPGVDPEDSLATLPDPPLSGNMFSIFLSDQEIPTRWPKTGNATVRRGSIAPPNPIEGPPPPFNTLRVEVTDPTDEVLVSNRVADTDPDGRAILTFRAKFQASAPVQLVTAVKSPPAAVDTLFRTVDSRVLPARAAWTQTQFFFLMDAMVYSMGVQGTGLASLFYLADVILKQVTPGTKIDSTSLTPGGGQTVYGFTGLVGNYLAVVVFDVGATTGTVTVQGDSYLANGTTQIGVVAPFTADAAGEAVVTVPDALPQSEVYVQEYLGFWEGTEV